MCAACCAGDRRIGVTYPPLKLTFHLCIELAGVGVCVCVHVGRGCVCMCLCWGGVSVRPWWAYVSVCLVGVSPDVCVAGGGSVCAMSASVGGRWSGPAFVCRLCVFVSGCSPVSVCVMAHRQLQPQPLVRGSPRTAPGTVGWAPPPQGQSSSPAQQLNCPHGLLPQHLPGPEATFWVPASLLIASLG